MNKVIIIEQYHRTSIRLSPKIYIVCLLVFSFLNLPAYSSTFLNKDSITYTTHYLADINSRLNKNDILNGSLDQNFGSINNIEHELPTKVYWIKIDFYNKSAEDKWVLEFDEYIHYIIVYADNVTKITGSYVPYDEKDIPSNKNIIGLNLATGSDGVIYAKIENTENIKQLPKLKLPILIYGKQTIFNIVLN